MMGLKKGDKKGTFLARLAIRQHEMRLRSNNDINPMRLKKNQCPICFQVHLVELPDYCMRNMCRIKSDSLEAQVNVYLKLNTHLNFTLK